MKKALTIVLIPIFLFATTIGVTMVAYYCAGTLKQKAFTVKPCCKDVNKGGCCKTQSELVKVKDSFVKVSYDFAFSFVIAEHKVIEISKFSPVLNLSYLASYRSNAPPITDRPIYLLYRSILV